MAVEEGRFLTVWVGLKDEDQQVVRPVALAGVEQDYLKQITISAKDEPEGHGPTGTAIREGRHDLCNDILNDPRMAPWREKALEVGYRSSASFPLGVAQEVIGAVTFYSGQLNFFTAEEVGLLTSLAGNLSFALESLDRDVKRRVAREALQASEEDLRLLASQLLTAQEDERRRLAHELHDDLGQSLLLLKLQLSGIARVLPPELEKPRQECVAAVDNVQEIIGNVRRLSQDLIPPALTDVGLKTALRVLLEEFCQLHELECSLDLDDTKGLFPPAMELNVYRIVQESLTNIGKYAQATRVTVSLKGKAHQVWLSVEDNGKGFEVDEVMARRGREKGLGLTSLAERARLMGGTLHLWSKPGEGTKVHLLVPLKNEALG